jgi:polar amino acid transport system substrate-binding protein
MRRLLFFTLVVALMLLIGLVPAACSSDTTTTTAPASSTTAAPVSTTAASAAGTTVASPAADDASWKTVQDRGQLIVGLCAEYPPFESRDASTNAPVGFDVDLANALGQKLGVQVKVVDAAWEGLLGGILKGDYDVLITAMSKEEAAAESVNMSDPYYDLAEVIVVGSDNTSITSVADLTGKVVGVQSACSAEKAVDKLTGLKEIKRYNRNPEAFIDLRAGRVEAVVVGEAYAATEAKGETGIKVIDAAVATNPLVFVSKVGGDALTAKLNGALAQLKSDGTYDQLVAKWFSFK